MSKRRGLPERAQMRHDSHFVDQLSRADELPIGRRIEAGEIDLENHGRFSKSVPGAPEA